VGGGEAGKIGGCKWQLRSVVDVKVSRFGERRSKAIGGLNG
jgi:hypothetical protein